jgi:hypothetical protein
MLLSANDNLHKVWAVLEASTANNRNVAREIQVSAEQCRLNVLIRDYLGISFSENNRSEFSAKN